MTVDELIAESRKEVEAMTLRAISMIAVAARDHSSAVLEAFCALNSLNLDDCRLPSEDDIARALARKIGVLSETLPH